MMSRFKAVCFDCDSTLSRVEGIDELARWAGCEPEISELTRAAMGGARPLQEVYASRLARVKPDRQAVQRLGERYIETMVEGARETVAQLSQAGLAVYVVSGGLKPAVERLAVELGVAASCICAVDVHFCDAGQYCGFDNASPLVRSGGKASVVASIIARHGPTAMVGDGVTDVEARDGGAYVIGFGGVVTRAAVQASADAFVATPDLRGILPFIFQVEDQAA